MRWYNDNDAMYWDDEGANDEGWSDDGGNAVDDAINARRAGER